MRPDGRLIGKNCHALCSPVVTHIFRQSQKAIWNYIRILPCSISTVKKANAPFIIFYLLATKTLGSAILFVEDWEIEPTGSQLFGSLLFSLAVKTAVNSIFSINTLENMVKLLLCGCDASRIIAMKSIHEHRSKLRFLAPLLCFL